MDAAPIPAAQLAAKARTPFPGESQDYRLARQALLPEEIEFRRHMTRVAAQRQALPEGPVVAKNYRFKDENGKTQLAHSLNGSSLALPRIFACILENFQQGDSIRLPKVLIPYFGKDIISK